MRVLKGKNNQISIISRPESKIITMIQADGFVPCDSLDERDLYVAEELYQKNLIKKVRKNNCIGFKTYSDIL